MRRVWATNAVKVEFFEMIVIFERRRLKFSIRLEIMQVRGWAPTTPVLWL